LLMRSTSLLTSTEAALLRVNRFRLRAAARHLWNDRASTYCRQEGHNPAPSGLCPLSLPKTRGQLSNSAKYCSIRSLRRITRLWASSVDVIPEVDGISDSYPPIEIHIGLTNWIRPMSIYVVAHIHDICRCDSPIGIAVTAVVFNHTDAAS